ncbi:hypothetical protein [Ferrimonas marina]|uniref:Uncharacterized protein n=1 Tax=Ferrimonas marina TaxID=299255 RepID=A0A1M5X190_9GAMM|nr:hypothetical protein [Ferrimonas marina]SHH93308.1 hypothetical protein SAMN02745129_3128 [Ferrimonas marina]
MQGQHKEKGSERRNIGYGVALAVGLMAIWSGPLAASQGSEGVVSDLVARMALLLLTLPLLPQLGLLAKLERRQGYGAYWLTLLLTAALVIAVVAYPQGWLATELAPEGRSLLGQAWQIPLAMLAMALLVVLYACWQHLPRSVNRLAVAALLLWLAGPLLALFAAPWGQPLALSLMLLASWSLLRGLSAELAQRSAQLQAQARAGNG